MNARAVDLWIRRGLQLSRPPAPRRPTSGGGNGPGGQPPTPEPPTNPTGPARTVTDFTVADFLIDAARAPAPREVSR